MLASHHGSLCGGSTIGGSRGAQDRGTSQGSMWPLACHLCIAGPQRPALRLPPFVHHCIADPSPPSQSLDDMVLIKPVSRWTATPREWHCESLRRQPPSVGRRDPARHACPDLMPLSTSSSSVTASPVSLAHPTFLHVGIMVIMVKVAAGSNPSSGLTLVMALPACWKSRPLPSPAAVHQPPPSFGSVRGSTPADALWSVITTR